MISNHSIIVLRAYSKLIGVGSAIEAEILGLLEGLKLAKAESLSNFLVEGDDAVVLSWVNKKEISLWMFDG